MDFGPLGLQEILFVGVLALLLFGPRRLPELARNLGRVATKLRRSTEELRHAFEDEVRRDENLRGLQDASRELTSLRDEMTASGRTVARQSRALIERADPGTGQAERKAEPPSSEGASAADRPDDDGD